jgi:histidyl-tRNA synthetase
VPEDRKFKWAIKHAERVGAARMVMVGAKEWNAGNVRVKDLAEFVEVDVPIAELC